MIQLESNFSEIAWRRTTVYREYTTAIDESERAKRLDTVLLSEDRSKLQSILGRLNDSGRIYCE